MRSHHQPPSILPLSFTLLAAALFWFGLAGDRAAGEPRESAAPRGAGPSPIVALPFTAAECGSYVVTDCLTGVAGSHGITVAADDVTIDLAGFTLAGVPGSLAGVHVAGVRRNLTLVGGTIESWGVDGVDALSLHGGRFERLTLDGNGRDGLRAGDRARVQDCLATGNARNGIFVSNFSRVVENEIHFNGIGGDPNAAGVFVSGTDNWISGNNATGNSKHGFHLQGPGNLVIRNCATGNRLGGFVDVHLANALGEVLQVSGSSGFVNDDPTANLEY